MKYLDFGNGHGRNFDHLTIVISKFWPWSWSMLINISQYRSILIDDIGKIQFSLISDDQY